MPDFSVITQNPTIRALVQDGVLERAFHDSLFPRMLYRGEATPELWPGNIGDRMIFTGAGLMDPTLTPIVPGDDAQVSTFSAEQWDSTLQQYGRSVDTAMPTSINAIADLFLRNAQQLGLHAAQSLNRIPRERLYAAALSGNTVATTSGSTATTIHVQRLNGFTTARRPDLSTGSPVQFGPVTANNPLAIVVGSTAVNVVGYTPDTAGDQVGPGTLSLDASISWSSRAAVVSSDATPIVRSGGSTTIDGLSTSNLFTLANIRSVVATLRQNNVPEFADGRYHCHLDPTSEAEIFADNEFQRLLTALPDHYMYKQFSIGELLGVVYLRNSEAPIPDTVKNAGPAGTPPYAYSVLDPFAGELANASSVVVHRPLFVGSGGLMEYYNDLSQLITEAGVTGKVGEPTITNNSIEVPTDRIQLILRSPLNRLQDKVSTTWKFIGDWPFRTDVTTGSAARYKRALTVEHG